MLKYASAYRGRRVLITGHTGFKGGWLALWLHRLGAEVAGYALAPPSEPSLFSGAELTHILDAHIVGDIRDAAALQAAFDHFKPEVVFHLAAQPLVRLSYRAPDLTFETNVMGTLRVLEAARRADSVRALINVSSDKCYENQEWPWGYRETDRLGGRDPYSASKGCAELLFSAWHRSFFPPERYGHEHRVAAASARAGNVVGGGDWGEDRLVPDCIRALLGKKVITLRAPGATRPWQHVLEPLSGYLELGAHLMEDASRYGGGWNFGPSGEDEWTVEAVVRTLCDTWGEGRYRVAADGGPHEAYRLRLDCAKANLELGWRPRWSVPRALEETVAWYQAFYRIRDPRRTRALCLDQIEAYEAGITDVSDPPLALSA